MEGYPQRPPLDVAGALANALGDRDFLKELLDLFVRETDPAIEKLDSAVRGGQAEAIMRIAHSLKSSSGNLRADHLSSCAYKLELMGRSHELAGATQVFEELCQEYTRLRSFTNSLML
jgi:HPt (histidine-containing phosphotransfer) domain-containing protein